MSAADRDEARCLSRPTWNCSLGSTDTMGLQCAGTLDRNWVQRMPGEDLTLPQKVAEGTWTFSAKAADEHSTPKPFQFSETKQQVPRACANSKPQEMSLSERKRKIQRKRERERDEGPDQGHQENTPGPSNGCPTEIPK